MDLTELAHNYNYDKDGKEIFAAEPVINYLPKDIRPPSDNAQVEKERGERGDEGLFDWTELIDDGLPYDFTIYPLLKGEMGILYGPGGVGKTRFLKHLFSNKNNPLFFKPLDILFLSLEDGQKNLVKKINGDMDMIHNSLTVAFHKNKDFYMDWTKYDLVIIDTLSKWNAGQVSENDNTEMQKMAADLLERAKRFDCSVLITSHTNKQAHNEKGPNVNNLRGASASKDEARGAYELYQGYDSDGNKEEFIKFLITKGNNADQGFKPCDFKFDDNGDIQVYNFSNFTNEELDPKTRPAPTGDNYTRKDNLPEDF